MGKVWDLDIPTNQLLVLLAMADHADHDGNNVYPSIGLVAWKTGYSDRHVMRIIKSLIKTKILSVVKREQGKTTHYRIDLSHGRLKEPYNPRQNVRGTPDADVTTRKPTHDTDVTSTPDIAVSPTPDIAVSHEPSVNRHKEPFAHTSPPNNTTQGSPTKGFVKLPTSEVVKVDRIAGKIVHVTVNGKAKEYLIDSVEFVDKPESENQSITVQDLFTVYRDVTGATSTVTNTSNNRRIASELIKSGITPDDIKRFVEHYASEEWRNNKVPSWYTIGKDINKWVVSKKPSQPAYVTTVDDYDYEDHARQWAAYYAEQGNTNASKTDVTAKDQEAA